MTYKLIRNPFSGEVDQVRFTDTTSIVKLIPFAPGNSLYQDYLKWVSEGNTADPAD